MAMPVTQSSIAAPSPFYTESPVANAAAQSGNFNVPSTQTQKVNLLVNFTIGSLTNATIQPQLSVDGTNWFNAPLDPRMPLTATQKIAIPVECVGAKLLRAQVTSTGTATGSTVIFDIAYCAWEITN